MIILKSEKRTSPSKERYYLKNPSVSCRLPIESREKLRQMADKEGLTISAYMKKMLEGYIVGIEDLNDAQLKGYEMGVKEGHQRGFKVGYQNGLKAGFEKAEEKYKINVVCANCSRLMTIKVGSYLHHEIIKFVKENYCCEDCSQSE